VDTQPPTLWSGRDVAAWLGQSTMRVMRMVRAHEIPHVSLPGGAIAFDPGELTRWLDGLRNREVTHAG
jgi:hypothetical protein